ncbi:G patch domain-containing protein 2-like [Amphibalanus amphitrite]|uniref:G patch domain-containing protein 2-like n=1 Tax=Amphibalanus amphitrite TaxID=1232801 RepID=UPI001C909D51|nr:G patch domain-containing protein 2-like [Amphibalanus amphitrite]
MDPSLIRRLQRLHVLRAGGPERRQRGRRSMEALVRDLSHALEESSSSSHRRRRGWRRRSRSAGTLSGAPPRAYSEDSGSSVGEAHLSTERQISSVQVSDSDEMVSTAGILSHSRRTQRHRLSATACLAGPLGESDSVNENFSPARLQRRKRKLKRMALDSEMSQPSTSSVGLPPGAGAGSVSELSRKRSKMQDGYSDPRHGSLRRMWKRKCDRKEGGMFPPRRPLQDQEEMECSDLDRLHGDMLSSSSLSSAGESDGLDDPGVYTNDEGREGDDEQSDWYHEPADEPPERTARPARPAAAAAAAAASGRSGPIKPSREIRAGRRRLRDRRPAFSIVSSLNDRVAAFLQDPQQTEVHLQTGGAKAEEDQLGHLANLYSLRVRRDAPGSFSAFKTGMTTRGVLVSPEYQGRGGSGDSKRRRRTTPSVSVDQFCVPAEPRGAPSVPWLQPLQPLPLAAGEAGCSRPTSGDGHTPVPPESSSPQTTEEPHSPANDAE